MHSPDNCRPAAYTLFRHTTRPHVKRRKDFTTQDDNGMKGTMASQKHHKRLLSFSLFMGVTLGIIFLNIPSTIDTLMTLYTVGYGDISLLISGLLWSHALIQLPGGIFTDRIGLMKALLVSLSCMFVGNLIPVITPSFFIAVGGRFIAGIGTGISFIAVMKLIALSFPPHRAGVYQSFFGGSFSIGSIIAYLLIPKIADLGWRPIYLFPSLLCLPLGVMLATLRLPWTDAGRRDAMPLTAIMSVREGWILGLIHALSFGAMLTLAHWVPSLLADLMQESTAEKLAWTGALLMLISGIGRIGGGLILLRVRAASVVNGTMILLAFVFGGLFWTRDPLFVLFLVLLAAVGTSINFGAIFTIASRVTTDSTLATLFSFVNFLANMGSVIFILMFGWVKDYTGNFSSGFAALAMLSAAAFFVGRSSFKRG